MVPCAERSLQPKVVNPSFPRLFFPKFVTGNLFDYELIVGLVVVEGAGYIVPISPHIGSLVVIGEDRPYPRNGPRPANAGPIVRRNEGFRAICRSSRPMLFEDPCPRQGEIGRFHRESEGVHEGRGKARLTKSRK